MEATARLHCIEASTPKFNSIAASLTTWQPCSGLRPPGKLAGSSFAEHPGRLEDDEECDEDNIVEARLWHGLGWGLCCCRAASLLAVTTAVTAMTCLQALLQYLQFPDSARGDPDPKA